MAASAVQRLPSAAMVGVGKYKVRPLKTERSDSKKILKVYLSGRALTIHSLRSDEWCQLFSASGTTFFVQVWAAQGNVQDTWIQINDDLRARYKLSLGDEVHLQRCEKTSLPNTEDVAVSECQDGYQEDYPPEERLHWIWLLDYEMEQAEILCPGMILNPRAKGKERAFRIDSINGSHTSAAYQYAAQTRNTIAPRDAPSSDLPNDVAGGRPAILEAAVLGGLDAQVSRLNSEIEKYESSADLFSAKSTHRQREGAVIIHGPSGTGKSKLLRMVAELGLWGKVYNMADIMNGAPKGRKDEAIGQMFRDASGCEPSAIIIDGLDLLTNKDESMYDSQSSSIVTSLCKGLDARNNNRILVVAAARNLSLVDESLRYPGRFETEIEIPVPGTEARAQILSLAFGSPRNCKDEQLLQLAHSTHGYVGSDLKQLLKTAMDQVTIRLRTSSHNEQQDEVSNLDRDNLTFSESFTKCDIETALLQVKPTAMKEIFLDTPRVKWEDIGGQHDLKKALRKAIEWPLKHRSTMEQRGLSAKKGLLLYGPPGCSKTLIAKAVATEAKLNFIAVKGAELLKMYVGESERAVREVFQKARGAAPSIIFFDEIDSIGGSRADSPQGGLHVLTTLLNELDGIEALRGVFVLAATNRPQILDPALLRPGRLESSLYVGLPEYQTRTEIIAKQTQRMCIGADFDAAELAKATDGYSGAEVVQLCQEAGNAAFEEELEAGQAQPQPIDMRHFDAAFKKVAKQVTSEMVREYETWRDREQLQVNRDQERTTVDTSMVRDIVATIAQMLLDSCRII